MPVYVKQNRILNNKVYSSSIINPLIINNHINSSTINKLQNKNASTDRLVYSYQDPYYNGIGQFTRNSSCWINGVTNISCFSPAQLNGTTWQQKAGTLLTTKHVIFAKHFKPSIISGGTPLIFVDENNNVVRRNLVQTVDDIIGDICIGLLDTDVPNNIKIAKVLPKNYNQYITIGNTNNIPNPPTDILAIGLDQEEKAILMAWESVYDIVYPNSGNPITSQGTLIVTTNTTGVSSSFTTYNAFTETIVSGDSGNPAFVIIDNELVLLSCWLVPTGGPFVTARYDAINSMIENLSPGQGYSLTPVDLNLVYNKYNN